MKRILIIAAGLLLTGLVTRAETPRLTIFMEDGGCCWYQNPRAIIKDGKLIIGGISGKTGDIRVGIYDLQKVTPCSSGCTGRRPIFGSIRAMWQA